MPERTCSPPDLTEPGDPNYSENLQITQSARFGFGAYYHMQRFYCGVSIPTLTEFGETARQAEPHVLTTAGVVIKASDGVMLKPSFLAKYGRGAPISWDLNFHALFQERIWLGAGWRTGDAIVSMMEIQGDPRTPHRIRPRLHVERHPQLQHRLQ